MARSDVGEGTGVILGLVDQLWDPIVGLGDTRTRWERCDLGM